MTIIEIGTKNDLDELEQLYHDLIHHLNLHTNYPGWIKDIYPVRETAETAIEEGTLHVVRMNGSIAGTVILGQGEEPAYSKADWQINLDDNNIIVIHTLAVHPLYLGKGIGSILMDFVDEYSMKRKAKAIRLDVYEKNAPAIRLYQKFGFQYMDTIDLGYGHHGLYWFKLYQKVL